MFSTNPTNVWVEHQKREDGKSNYTLYKIIKLVSRILFNYSIWPLRIVSTIGFLASVAGFVIGVILLALRLANKIQVTGWTGIMVMLSFFNGLIVLILGMLGEYIIRILQQVSSRKIYHIREVVTPNA